MTRLRRVVLDIDDISVVHKITTDQENQCKASYFVMKVPDNPQHRLIHDQRYLFHQPDGSIVRFKQGLHQNYSDF